MTKKEKILKMLKQFTGACKIKENGLAAGCQLFYRKIYGYFLQCVFIITTGDIKCRVATVAETKRADYANRVDFDEVAHNKPPYLDLHCLLSNL